MNQKPTKERLWGDDAKDAETIAEWFDLFRKLRRLADLSPADAIQQIRRINPSDLRRAQTCLHVMLMERFQLTEGKIDHGISSSRGGVKGAEIRWANHEDISAATKKLAKQRDEYGDYLEPDELWPELYSELEARGLKVQEIESPRKYLSDVGETTYEAFRKAIQRARKGK